MFATVMYGPGDVRFEKVDDPKIIKPTDAIIKLSATCICGSDLWPYRGLQPNEGPAHMGHEYCGVVVEVGAVGLMGVLAAKEMGAERIIAMSRHKTRQDLAKEFGATEIVAERGDAGIERIKELTRGVGADSVLECVGTQEAMTQAI